MRRPTTLAAQNAVATAAVRMGAMFVHSSARQCVYARRLRHLVQPVCAHHLSELAARKRFAASGWATLLLVVGL
jgi:hypothetical protein